MHKRHFACKTVFLIATWCWASPFCHWKLRHCETKGRSPCSQHTVYFMHMAGATSPTSAVSLKCFPIPLGCMVNGNSGSSHNAIRHLSWISDYWEGCMKPSFLKHRRNSTENTAYLLVLHSKPLLVSTLAKSSGICQKHATFFCWLALLFLVHLCSFFPTATPLKTTLCSVSAAWSSPNPKEYMACPFFGALG